MKAQRKDVMRFFPIQFVVLKGQNELGQVQYFPYLQNKVLLKHVGARLNPAINDNY
jgi:hypothetical protein